jgi:hypothetical protein
MEELQVIKQAIEIAVKAGVYANGRCCGFVANIG